MIENGIGTIVVENAMALHRNLGPGSLGSVHETALAHDLERRGLSAERQVPVSFECNGLKLDECFRADIVVGCVNGLKE